MELDIVLITQDWASELDLVNISSRDICGKCINNGIPVEANIVYWLTLCPCDYIHTSYCFAKVQPDQLPMHSEYWIPLEMTDGDGWI